MVFNMFCEKLKLNLCQKKKGIVVFEADQKRKEVISFEIERVLNNTLFNII